MATKELAAPSWDETARDEYERTRELSYRRSGQTEVFLKWIREANVIFIALRGSGLDRAFLVPNDKGNEAFEHPFAYMPTERDEYGLESLPEHLR